VYLIGTSVPAYYKTISLRGVKAEESLF
jgi:hypothetical protein